MAQPNAKPSFVMPPDPWYNASVGEPIAISVTVYDQDGDPLGVNWSFGEGDWEFDFLASGNPPVTINRSHVYSAPNPTGYPVRVTVSDFQQGHQVNATSRVYVNDPNPRTVDYRWYDMFNVPFGSWYDVRWQKTGIEQPLTHSYPYIYKWHGAPVGNHVYYTMMRLNITGWDIPEINMNSRPVFLPLMGTERGGYAAIDWYMQYMTHEEVAARLPPTVAAWDDGWFVRLSGTTTLDQQAAKAVIGLSDYGYNDFVSWWAVNGAIVSKNYMDWLKAEGNQRLDIWPMYEYTLTFIDWSFSANKVGSYIVLHYDYITWGMEALMTRWLHDSFMPTEWYFEDMDFNLWISPNDADIASDAAVQYAAYAWNDYGEDPVWCWEAMMQDYVKSTIVHPHSDFDRYAPYSYVNLEPGSAWYGKMMPYDYTPGAWNLSAGETLQFEWPAGEQLFIGQAFDGYGAPIIGQTVNQSADMAITYSEPDSSDFPTKVAIDTDMRTMTFTGPIDMWSWSKSQSAHQGLANEWDRLGLQPYGIPFIEFGMAAPQPVTPRIDYRLYDMFEPEFGEWFWTTKPWGRMANYNMDYIVWNETGKHAYLYVPDPNGEPERSLIFAPYRWSMNATNIDWVTVDHPYIMPSVADGFVPGAEATIDLYFQYISRDVWQKYWIPTWGWLRPDHPYNESMMMKAWFDGQADGYQIGAVYNITMNRQAAYEWLGIPLGADVAAWYNNGNGIDFLNYQLDWISWIDNEANNRLDIFSGYNDLWYPGFNWMKVSEVPGSGDVRLTIAEVDWGYEVLMTRWLAEANLNPSEPYWEDFSLKATLNDQGANIWFDAVGMYNLRAVRSTDNSTNGGAWAWDPTHIDYVPSWAGGRYHPSEYDSYAYLTYTSWDSGNTETYWGQQVHYTATPARFNLASYMTLTVELPTGSDVPFYIGQPVPTGSINRLRQGNSADYDALKYTGSSTLGFTVPYLGSNYDPYTQTLSLCGPMYPDYPRNATGLLYQGAPWIEIESVRTEPPHAATVYLSGLPNATDAGAPMSAIVVVYDQYGSIYTNFTGMVVFRSSDPLATLPPAYNFTWMDRGVHMYTGIVLRTGGLQNISAFIASEPWLESTRMVYVVSTTNTPPVARFNVMPDHGDLQTIFQLDASSSYDAESSLMYRWDWEGDGNWDTGWQGSPTAQHSYKHFGVYGTTLEVRDSGGLTDSTSKDVSVGVYVFVKGNQRASKAVWTFTPQVSSEFTLAIDNNGLRGLTIDVVDITTGAPVGVHHERLRFFDGYGVYYSESMIVLQGHEYLFTLTPLGHKGTFALAYGAQSYWPPPPLVAGFAYTVIFNSVWVDAIGCSPAELIVSYQWDWGDGTNGSGLSSNHTYYGSWPGDVWTITLTVTDVYGRKAQCALQVTILPP